jgi:hypothetical protein
MSIIRRCALCLVFLTLVADAFARGNTDHHQRRVLASAPSVQFAPELRSEVEDVLQRSATFRAQYRRIAAARWLAVGVTVDVRLCETSYRARTTFRRYQSGLTVAAVALGPGSHHGEWIAHEFEHILEQLDGRNLPQLANRHAKDVWYSGSDLIETERAIRAGRAVRDEMRQSQNTW